MTRIEVETALILCGGLGTRLRTVVDDRPKCLADIAGRPFLAYLLDQLRTAGVRRVVLCTGYLGDMIEAAFGSDYEGIELLYSREPRPLGTGGALRLAIEHVGVRRVTVLNGDSYCGLDLRTFHAWADRAGAPAQMVRVTVADSSRYGRVEASRTGVVQSFVEKGGMAGPGPINAGIYRFDSALLRDLAVDTPCALEHEVLPGLVGGSLQAWTSDATFVDIGTPASHAAAQSIFGGAAAGLLLLDRDGTIIREKHYLSDPEEVELLPGVVEALQEFQRRGYEVAIVTNQSGIGRGYYGETDLQAVNARMLALLEDAGIQVRGVWHCPHTPAAGCACRKPGIGLFEAATAELQFAADDCVVVGDKPCDIELGKNAGARTVLVRTGYGAETEAAGACQPDVIVSDLRELVGLETPR